MDNYTTLEHLILTALRDSPRVGQQDTMYSMEAFRDSLPQSQMWTVDQVTHALAVMALEGLIYRVDMTICGYKAEDRVETVLDITQYGLRILRNQTKVTAC